MYTSAKTSVFKEIIRYLKEFICTVLFISGATDYVEQNLAASHPLRLGLAMNFSVFIYDMLGDTDAAREHAKKFYDEALDEIESVREVDESRYNECVGLLRLLHENIKVWSPPGAPTTRRTNNPTTMAPTDNSLKAF